MVLWKTQSLCLFGMPWLKARASIQLHSWFSLSVCPFCSFKCWWQGSLQGLSSHKILQRSQWHGRLSLPDAVQTHHEPQYLPGVRHKPYLGQVGNPHAFCNKDTMPSIIPAWLFKWSSHICQWHHWDIALCISCFDCGLTNCSALTLIAGTHSMVRGILMSGKQAELIELLHITLQN